MRVLTAAKFKKKLKFNGISEIKLRIWPNDIDVYPEMNNGRHLTLMDLGRYDLALRSGMLRTAKKNKWKFVVAGGSIRFRRRLPPFRSFQLKSRLSGWDKRWFYFIQETLRNRKVCSQAVIRAGIRDKQGLVPAEKVVKIFGESESIRLNIPDWVMEWIKAEESRPEL